MSYIFGDLKTKLQTQIGDPNLSDSVAGDALNYTEQSIFNTLDLTLNSDTTTGTLSSGTHTLTTTIASDFQRIYSLYVTSPTNYSRDITDGYLSPQDFRRAFPNRSLLGTGPPDYWTYFTEVEFAFNADQNYTITVDYIKTIPFMSLSTDVPTVPQSFEELLMLGAKIRVYEQKEDFDYAAQFTNRYADLLEAFQLRYSLRQVDKQANVPGARIRV